MKRLLSVLLAIMLIATFLPVGQVFATEGEENTGICIKYDILGAVTEIGGAWEGKDAADKKPFTILNWELSGGFFNFASSSGIDEIYSNASSINYSPKVGIQLGKGNKFALEIYVPKAGTYDMKMLYGNSVASAKTHVYVNRDAVSYAASDKVGYYECRVENTIDYEKNRKDPSELLQLAHTFEAIIEDIVFDEAGTYYVSFYSDGNYGSVGTFYLTENGTGTGNSVVSIDTSIDRKRLTLDENKTAQISVDTIRLGDKTVVNDLSAYTVKYTSSNDKIATVDASGKITAAGEGVAEITVTVTDSFGAIATSKEEIAVDGSGCVLEYNFARTQITGPVSEWVDYTYGEANTEKRAGIISKAKFANATYDKSYGFYKFVDSNADTTAYQVKKRSVNENGEYYYTDATKRYYVTETTGEKVAISDAYFPGCGIRCYGYAYQIASAKYISFEINVPIAGEFDVEIVYPSQTNTAYNRDGKVYISKNGVSTSEEDLVGTFNAYNSSLTAGTVVTKIINKYTFDKPGKYTVTFMGGGTGGHTILSGMILTNGVSGAVIGKITSDKNIINVDEKETATVTASGYLSDTAIDLLTTASVKVTDPTAIAGFTYSSSDTAIAEVDAETGVVTPKKAGKVTITATAKGATVANTLTTEIEVTENKPGEEVAEKVSIYITKTEGGSVSADKVAVNEVTTANTGETITAEAEANDGYKFAYWKDSAGNVVSEDVKYTFKAFTNTSIIAVFDNVSGDAKKYGVEFFDGNRDFLGFVETEEGATFGSIENLPNHGLTGYAPKGWSIAENAIINGILRAVALYEEEGKEVSGITFNNGTVENTKYDEPVSNTVEGVKTWYRDEKLVGYGDSYTYYVWGDTNITSSTEDVEKKLPIAVLDKNGDSYMLEYDNAGYTIVDAGILFGNDTHKEVNSCYYKAKVKNIKAHGQFTAKKSVDTGSESKQTVVRGYVMFKDTDESLRVIYAD